MIVQTAPIPSILIRAAILGPRGLTLMLSRVSKTLGRTGAAPWIAAVGLALLYGFLSVAVLPPALFWSPDTACKFLQLQNLRWNGGLDDSIAYPGRDLDPELRFLPFDDPFVRVGADRTIHFVWPPLFALLCLPLFRAFGGVGLHVLPVLAGVGSAALAGLLARRIAGGGGLVAGALAGVATPLFCYSLLFWEHTLGTLLSTLGVWWLLGRRDGGFSWRAAGAGCALAAASALRSEVLMLVLALTLVGLVLPCGNGSRRAAGWTAGAAFVATSAPIWLYQLATTGRALPVTTVNRWAGLNVARILEAPQHLIPDLLVGDNVPLVLAVPFCLAIAATLALSWFGRGRMGAAAFFAGLAAVAVTGVQVLAWMNPRLPSSSAFHGMLAVAPLLVVGLCRPPGAAVGATEGAAYRFLLWTTVVYAAVYAGSAVLTENGGLEWGPRFFLPAYPLLAALTVGWWRRGDPALRRTSLGRAAIVALALLSIAAQGRGVVGIHTGLRWQLAVNEAVEGIADGSPLIATRWWMPTVVIGSYRRIPMFHVADRAGIERWLAAAAARGLDGFWLLGVDAQIERFMDRRGRDAPEPGPPQLDPLLQPPWPAGLRLRPEAPVGVEGLTLTHVALLAPRAD